MNPASCLVTVATLLLVQDACAQYVTLASDHNESASQTINIASNELATVVHLSTSNDSSANNALVVVCGGITNRYIVGHMIGGYAAASSGRFFAHANLPIIAGPASLWVQSSPGTVFCTLLITKPTSNSLTPVNTVVIPQDSAGPVKIVLESSADMVNWVAASPGTYGTTFSNRFFRVRAER